VEAGDFLTNAPTLPDIPATGALCGYAAAEISLLPVLRGLLLSVLAFAPGAPFTLDDDTWLWGRAGDHATPETDHHEFLTQTPHCLRRVRVALFVQHGLGSLE
jgi:hypothetical protein